MESLKRTIRFLNIDMKSSVIIFWIVMILVNTGSYLLNIASSININTNSIAIGFQISDGEMLGLVSVAGANIMPMLIFYTVYTYTTYYEDLPIAIGFSGTRKNFFLSNIINNVMVAFIFALVQTILLKIDIKLVENLYLVPYTNFGVFNSLEDNVIIILLSIFLISICFLGFMNLLASANYKFGYKMWILLAVAFFVIMPFLGFEIFSLSYNLLSRRIDFLQFMLLSLITVITYGLNSLFIREINIKPKLA